MEKKTKTIRLKSKEDSIDILFCGLIREHETFKKSIEDFVLMKKEGIAGEIFLSTWIGELQKNPEISDFLKKNNVRIIESEEPKEAGYGSVWCQMKALEAGLNKIKSGRFVLRTRSDVYINPDFVKTLFNKKKNLLKITRDLPNGNIFHYKIWVPWYEITRPFYLGDEAFFGAKEDLMHLVNYDKRYDEELNSGTGITHIRRFIHPFVEDYPVLYKYLNNFKHEGRLKSLAVKIKDKKIFDLRRFSILRDINRIKRFRELNKRLKDRNYIEILSAYYSILYSHFYIDGDSYPDQVKFSKAAPPLKRIDSELIEKNFSQEKAVSRYGGQINDYNMALLKNVCEKKLIETPFSKKLMGAIDEFNNQID